MATRETRKAMRVNDQHPHPIQRRSSSFVLRPSSFLRVWAFRALALSLVLCLCVTASGQTPRDEKKAGPLPKDAVQKPDASRGGKKLPAWSAEREVDALAFVQQHQPELSRLLVYLRRHDPRQYQRAIRELVRVAERLAQTKQRDARRYELELQLWKTRSRIDLLAAQWQMHPSDELRERLRATVAQQLAQQKNLLVGERDRVAERLTKLDAQISTFEAQQETEIERRMQLLTDAKRKKAAAPAAKKQPDADHDEH